MLINPGTPLRTIVMNDGMIGHNGGPPSFASLVASLFASGAPGAAWDFTDDAHLWTDTAGTTLAGMGDYVARVDDLSGNGSNATQASAALQPLLQDGYLAGDFVDDWLSAPLVPGPYAMTYGTPLGFMVSGMGQYGAATRIPLGRTVGNIVLGRSLTADEREQLAEVWGVPEYTFVGYTSKSTVFHNITGAPVIRYVGANGIVFDQTANNVTTNLADQGLTPPYAMLIPLTVKNNTALTTFLCYSNQLTGSIPSLSANTALTTFWCFSNQLTGWSGGAVSPTLGDFRAQGNQLPQATIDALLAAFDAAGRNSGTRTLNLGGTGNAAPSSAGAVSKANLQAKGWTVTTN